MTMMTDEDWDWLAKRLFPVLLPTQEEDRRARRLVKKSLPATIQYWYRGKWPRPTCEDLAQVALEKYMKAAGVKPAARTGPFLKKVVANHCLDALRQQASRRKTLIFDYEREPNQQMQPEAAAQHLDSLYFDSHGRFDQTALHLGRLKLEEVIRRGIVLFQGADEEVWLVFQLFVEALYYDARRSELELLHAVREDLREREMPEKTIRAVIPRFTRKGRPFFAELSRALPR